MMIADAMALLRQRIAQMHELESQSEWRVTAMTWTWTNTQTTCHSTCSEAFLFKGAQCSFAVLICCNPNGRSDKRNRQAHTKPSSLKNITKTPSSMKLRLAPSQFHEWIARVVVYTCPDSLADRVFMDQSGAVWDSTLARLGLLAKLHGKLRSSMDEA
ncbi:hypothetical protein HBH56_032010 [Parastagonospora nodorum]|uniref:Uncharacterized protein n=1 Tax=Phaeosphaeria nodorum (strain SN15 / ATCC MYA-4574 / FGSC 10173) TaxID=321614 RepID=A0A7U2F7V6_PHANO|nr:hypothetical protein HBH56_032010 [Parastagonospora nodorum]QRD00361.1 hypothetical protein JI435_305080 [Parastagonospora nodorum SN15]KAH3933971.1 hypothetical protein HBH54_067440 [Parastagonospora nodorum]KAH3952401.1 hypothetical protein HBH53_042610 [Parastagonospora nodorum]KAH3979971.1 hypothetical protein HBH51_053640 [Parastagonospora nodorum]